ncbi:MAG: thioesterase family protein [Henriciella sp.]
MTFWQPYPDRNGSGIFRLTVRPEACVGPDHNSQFFMGGVAFATAISALEAQFQAPLLWSNIQFLSQGRLGDDIQIEITKRGGGKTVHQVGAIVTAGDRLLQMVQGALGRRSSDYESRFLTAPRVRPPQECEEKAPDAFAQPGNLLDQFERRTALQNDESGREDLWFRPKFPTDISAGLLAIMADFLLGAHTRTRGGTSLDNTLRVHALKPTAWVLNQVQLQSIKDGLVHGTVHQFAEDGTLLSSGSQTGLLPKR